MLKYCLPLCLLASASIGDDVLPEDEARAACEDEHLPEVLRAARAGLLYGYTDHERSELAELGVDLVERQPVAGLTVSQAEELDEVVIKSLIANYRVRMNFCVLGKTLKDEEFTEVLHRLAEEERE